MKKLISQSSKTKKIRKGDTVVVIAGNERGRVGTVQSCKEDTVVVQGLNVRKKHVKPNQAAPKGRIIEMERPIHVSNVKLYVDGKAVKVKVRTDKQGDRQFVYQAGDQEVVYRSIKKPK